MTTIKLRHSLFLVTIAAGMLAAGCELIVDFDRTLIPVAVLDSGVPLDAAGLPTGDAQTVLDATLVDSQTPADSGEQPQTEAGTDAGNPQDAATDG